MLTIIKQKTNLLLFLAGAFSALTVILLTGATNSTSVGRYEMEVAHRDRTYQIYVLDTATGTVKWVDSMNTPFEDLKRD